MTQHSSEDLVGAETIRTFCEKYQISQAHYFVQARAGRMPAVIKIGRKTLIPRESIRDWLQKKIAEAA